MAKHKFQTEVNQLLHLIIHSLYSHREIFLRELVSNASDALDRLKYLTLTDEEFKKISFDPRIDIEFDEKKQKTLTIRDNGIGMNDKELEENLGTIARSGTRNFIEHLTGDARKDSNLIGQFGVGFYSAFMVAESIEVISRKAGEDKAWKWTSDGKGEFEITEAERETQGTTVILHLNKEGSEFADRWRIESIIKKYSNHIPFPIYLKYTATRFEGEGDKKKEKKEETVTQINAASAIWKRPKAELTDEDYAEFYKSFSHDYSEPLLRIHTHAEGKLDYTTLFFIPSKAPFDLFRADYRPGVKLYVKRVFITDDDRELMPVYLRFVRGVIDSEDLPLNVSREMLQHNQILSKIRTSSVKRILDELMKLQKNDRKKYETFWKEFGVPMKEGLYQDRENRDALLDLALFKSTKVEGYTTFAEYKERMQPDQDAIYYITGSSEDAIRNSPLLEVYRKKDIEVLVLDDEIDDIVISSVFTYKDTPLKSVNRADAAESLKTDEDKKREQEIEPLIKKIREALGDRVKDVRASSRLSDSPSCIVADENDPTVQMQHIFKAMGQKGLPDFKPILEVNPNHEIITKLAGIDDTALIQDASFLLLEQAMLIEGVEIKNPAEFAKRLNRIMSRAL